MPLKHPKIGSSGFGQVIVIMGVLAACVAAVFILQKDKIVKSGDPGTPTEKAKQITKDLVDYVNDPSKQSTDSENKPRTLQPETLSKTVSGKIAFIKGNELYVINADRTGEKQLTFDKTLKGNLTVSPNGRFIAYIYREENAKNVGQGIVPIYNYDIGVFNLETNNLSVLTKYAPADAYGYLAFSKDSDYLSAWTGTNKSVVFRISTGKIVRTVASQTQGVSPIVFLTNQKISYVENGSLVINDIYSDSNIQLIRTNVDAARPVHEGAPVPEPPFWSPSERYVTYYKKGTLYIFDKKQNIETLLAKGNEESVTGEPYPQGYPDSFVRNETGIIMQLGNDTVLYDLPSNTFEKINQFGSSLSTSFDKQRVFGLDTSTKAMSKGTFYLIDDAEVQTCDQNVKSVFYWWAGGTDYQSRYLTWSPDSNAVLVTGGYETHETDVTKILMIDSCYLYDLVIGATASTWIPPIQR